MFVCCVARLVDGLPDGTNSMEREGSAWQALLVVHPCRAEFPHVCLFAALLA